MTLLLCGVGENAMQNAARADVALGDVLTTRIPNGCTPTSAMYVN
jgi:hypothetical protein